MSLPRFTARGRLTLLYTVVVFGAGIVMTALTYLLMRPSLVRRSYIDGEGDSTTDVPPIAGIDELIERDRMSILSDLLVTATIALVVVSLLAAVLGWFVGGRVLRPIRQISATSRRLSAENLAERVPLRTPTDELSQLTDTVNGMLDRIQAGVADRDRALASQRLFTANAAHELRTPLTTMRTAIDVTLDGEPSRDELLAMIADIDTTVERSRRVLDGMLALARGQAAIGENRPVDLAELAADLLDATVTADNPRIAIRRELRPAPVNGDPVMLERMVANLIDNALRCNHTDGQVVISTGTTPERTVARITNSGPHIAPDTAETLLEPFVRDGRDRVGSAGGAGLGLSIVRAIVTAHNGELSITANPGGGLDVTVAMVNVSVADRCGGWSTRQRRGAPSRQ